MSILRWLLCHVLNRHKWDSPNRMWGVCLRCGAWNDPMGG